MKLIAYKGGATFVINCHKCGRFVKSDNSIFINDSGEFRENATCKKCGRVKMNFFGFTT